MNLPKHKIGIGLIQPEPRLRMRVQAINQSVVLTYKAIMESGEKMPEPIVWQRKNFYAIIAGNHRIEASRLVLGNAGEIECFVFTGELPDALKLCFEESKKSRIAPFRYFDCDYKEQIRKATAIFTHMNQTQIAEMIGCHQTWVGRIMTQSKPLIKTSLKNPLHSKPNANKPPERPKTASPTTRTTSSPPKRKEPDLVRDSLGFPVPANVNDSWNQRHAMADWAKRIAALGEEFETKIHAEAPLFVTQSEAEQLASHLKDVVCRSLRDGAPYCVCPECEAYGPRMQDCRLCHGIGLLRKHTWESTPDKIKQAHESKLRSNS